jgi:hypothetical protein
MLIEFSFRSECYYVAWPIAIPLESARMCAMNVTLRIVCAVAVCMVSTFASVAPPAGRFAVSDYGARPNDGKNDLAGISKAIAACAKGGGGVVVFSKGRYDLTHTPKNRRPYFVLKGIKGMTIEGNGAMLVAHDVAGFFSVVDCSDLTVRKLTLDTDPLPFTCGRVVSTGRGYIDIKPAMGYRASGGRSVKGVLGYDPVKGRPARRGHDCYMLDNTTPSSVTDAGLMRVPCRGRLADGAHVIVRHDIYGHNGFTLRGCSKVLFEDLTIYSLGGMGIYAAASTDITVRRMAVRKGPDGKRWMSTTADATHFNTCRGTIMLEDCHFEGMGDDATNIHNHFWTVSGRRGEDTLRVTLKRVRRHVMPGNPPRAGDTIEIGGPENPLSPRSTRIVKAAQTDPKNKDLIITFTRPLAAKTRSGDIAWNISAAPKARIRRCTVKDNRARGMLIQTRDVILEGCLFENCSGAAIHVASDINYWHEGIGVRGLVIRNNRFIGCNYGAARRGAVVDIFSEIAAGKISPPGVHRGISLSGNRFVNPEGSGIHVNSADGVTITANKFVGPSDAAIFVNYSRNIRITGNVLTGGRKGGLKIGDKCNPDTVHAHKNSGF